MKSTREDTLNVIEQRRDELEDDHEKALLVAVYEQSKDAYLEMLTKQLIEALKRNDLAKMSQIEKKVKHYANSSAYRKRLSKKIAEQVSQKEAELFYTKEI